MSKLLIKVLDKFVGDFFRLCENLRDKNDPEAEEFCDFGSDIEAFTDLIVTIDEGKEAFVANVCENAQFFDSNGLNNISYVHIH